MSGKARILIVDDSGFMRIALRKMLAAEASVEVVGEARNGLEAIEMTRSLDPDIVTMDIEMPVLDGLDAVRTIMGEAPRPILMVSHLTQSGSEATVRALELGAVDFISKSSAFTQLDAAHIERELLEKIRYWARQGRSRFSARGGHGAHPAPTSTATSALSAAPSAAASAASAAAAAPGAGLRRVEPAGPVDLVVIGSSTGGPKVMFELLRGLAKLKCPVVLAQHMPAAFTRSFAQHLADDTGHKVIEGGNGGDILPGQIVVLPGGADWAVRKRAGEGFVLSRRDQPNLPVHPSVDQLFETAAECAAHPVAVILTGMGADGTLGAKKFFALKRPVLVQTPTTCAVDGMPGAAIAAGVASEVLAISGIARRLNGWVAQDPAPLKDK